MAKALLMPALIGPRRLNCSEKWRLQFDVRANEWIDFSQMRVFYRSLPGLLTIHFQGSAMHEIRRQSHVQALFESAQHSMSSPSSMQKSFACIPLSATL